MLPCIWAYLAGPLAALNCHQPVEVTSADLAPVPVRIRVRHCRLCGRCNAKHAELTYVE